MDKTLEPVWYALYTRSRHEKFVRAELQKRRIEAFLPTRRVQRRWSDRTVTLEEPLFKSYLFVKTDFSRPADVLSAKGAVRFVSAGLRPIPIREELIVSLRVAIQNQMTLDPFPYLNQGDRVFIKSGIFKGLEGFILRKDGPRCRLVISIDAMMASVSVEVDSCLVEKV